MKTILASAAALSLLASAAFAAEPIEPVVEPMDEVENQENDEPGAELLVPVLILGALVGIGGSSSATATTQ